jgi:uncharacterized membrane protein AbrB (regulator of aidB expression)
MSKLSVFRQAFTNWNRFVTAAILVAALLTKVGVPLAAILLGLATAGLVNWRLQRSNV